MLLILVLLSEFILLSRTIRNIPLDTDDESKLRLVRDVEVALLAGSASQTDTLTLSITVLLDVGLSALEDDTTLLLVGL